MLETVVYSSISVFERLRNEVIMNGYCTILILIFLNIFKTKILQMKYICEYRYEK